MFWIKNLLYKVRDKVLALLGYKTVGARALVIKDNQVLLVKHTYMPQWHTIGGAVDKGETPREAVQRELKEEVGITCLTPPSLIGVYYHLLKGRYDYVIFYLVIQFTQEKVKSSEILESRWFYLDKLPSDASAATKKRVEEYLKIREQSENW